MNTPIEKPIADEGFNEWFSENEPELVKLLEEDNFSGNILTLRAPMRMAWSGASETRIQQIACARAQVALMQKYNRAIAQEPIDHTADQAELACAITLLEKADQFRGTLVIPDDSQRSGFTAWMCGVSKFLRDCRSAKAQA